MEWAEQTLKPKAEMAYQGEGDYVPGPWCTFCKAAVKCRARAEAKLQLAKYEFAMPPLLTDAEIEDILSRLPGLTKWAGEIECLRPGRRHSSRQGVARLQTGGEPHQPQIHRRGSRDPRRQRRWVPRHLQEDPHLHHRDGEAHGQKAFAELLGSLVEKPKGRPTLVPVSDRRPAITTMGCRPRIY